MGSHSVQASGLLVFLLAFVVLAASALLNWNFSLALLGFAFLTISAAIFRRAKSREQSDE